MTDRLIFRQSATKDFHVGWAGPWPPPERMIVAEGRLTNGMAIFDPDEVAPEDIAELVRLGLTQTVYVLGAHSKMPEPWGPDEHIARAAEYTPEEKTDA